jgi:hypothetical protein
MNPTRVCDTRASNPSKLSGKANQCLAKTIAAGKSLTFSVAGFFNVPAKAAAVVLNVTAVNPASAGYLTGYSTGQPVPATPSFTMTAKGQPAANLVEVALGTG